MGRGVRDLCPSDSRPWRSPSVPSVASLNKEAPYQPACMALSARSIDVKFSAVGASFTPHVCLDHGRVDLGRKVLSLRSDP